VKFKKGDSVLVTIGKDRGKRGKIEKIFPKKDTVLVTGVNLYKRHLKSRGQNKQGGIIDITKPLSVAKIALVCPKCNQPTRIGYQLEEKGNSKSRICLKCKNLI
jgi:large subunit ribosomal protein L24